MDAYSNVIARVSFSSVMYKSLSPEPVNDLEDEGSMAQFQLAILDKADKEDGTISDTAETQANENESSGADVAA